MLSQWAIAPRKRFGQNFLHDARVSEKIAAAAEAAAGDHVVEIGPGLGALTRPLLASGAQVTAIEVDPRIADFLEEDLAGTRFRLVRGDVLDVDLGAEAPDATILVGNLPYSITGPLLGLIADHAARIDRAVIMVQKEVATRLLARAGGRELGSIAVLLRLLYRIERITDVGTGAFLPAPEVVSTVIRLQRRPGATLSPRLRELVRLAYQQRRKMLRKTLKGELASEEAIAARLVEIGRSETARPEELEPEDWPALLEIDGQAAAGEGSPC